MTKRVKTLKSIINLKRNRKQSLTLYNNLHKASLNVSNMSTQLESLIVIIDSLLERSNPYTIEKPS